MLGPDAFLPLKFCRRKRRVQRCNRCATHVLTWDPPGDTHRSSRLPAKEGRTAQEQPLSEFTCPSRPTKAAPLLSSGEAGSLGVQTHGPDDRTGRLTAPIGVLIAVSRAAHMRSHMCSHTSPEPTELSPVTLQMSGVFPTRGVPHLLDFHFPSE